MRRSHQSRLTPYQVGLIALVVIVVAVFLGASKDIPFTRPFELKAVFENAPPIHKGQAVRIAGVDIGKVSKVEPKGGTSPAVVVTMKLEDEALPIHKDARIKVRPRLFFEGCLSVAGFGALTPRHAAVRVIGLDERAEPVEIEARGWYARILQHEIDHLNGRLYVDSMLTRSFMTDAAYRKSWQEKSVAEISAELDLPHPLPRS